MLIANLGAGTKTSHDPSVLNIDWSIYYRVNRNHALRRLAGPLLFRGERRVKLDNLGSNTLTHDLRNGIPLPNSSTDAVYHSHVLEHIDHDAAPAFLAEIARVLKPGGIHRIAVPDFEKLCRDYLSDLESSLSGARPLHRHDEAISAMIHQMVRREAHGTSQQGPLRRKLENWMLGGARRRGETHQWMYDRVNLAALLEQSGFVDPRICSFNESSIPGWASIGLEVDNQLEEYKPDSLYMEAIRV